MNYIYATRYIRTIKTGLSKPVLLACNDDEKYVVKFASDNYSKNKVLINDYICSKLAEKVGIDVPKAEIIFIHNSLVEIEGDLKNRNVREGVHFGSLFVGETSGMFGESLLKSIINKEQIPKIIAFDLWVGNDDRANNPGNILFTLNHEPRIVTIDFGNSFNGPDWDSFDLNDDIILPPFDGEVYSCLKNYVLGEHPFDEICTQIEDISRADIQNCVDQIPEEWLFTELDRQLISQFLYDRRIVLRKYIDEIQLEGKYFPFWRR